MSVTVQWDDAEKTTLHYTYQGQWTWPEYEAAVTQALELAKDAGPSLYVIADFSQSSLLPDRALHNFRSSMNRGDRVIPFEITVLIMKSEFMARMFDVFGKLYGRGELGAKLKTASSVDEARQIIADRRASKHAAI
jgi:hypothetical protein